MLQAFFNLNFAIAVLVNSLKSYYFDADQDQFKHTDNIVNHYYCSITSLWGYTLHEIKNIAA